MEYRGPVLALFLPVTHEQFQGPSLSGRFWMPWLYHKSGVAYCVGESRRILKKVIPNPQALLVGAIRLCNFQRDLRLAPSPPQTPNPPGKLNRISREQTHRFQDVCSLGRVCFQLEQQADHARHRDALGDLSIALFFHRPGGRAGPQRDDHLVPSPGLCGIY